MLGNIIDNRSNRYAADVDAVFEPSWHDNSIVDATQFKRDKISVLFECWDRTNTTVHEAVLHAQSCQFVVTIYLYDAGSDPLSSHKGEDHTT